MQATPTAACPSLLAGGPKRCKRHRGWMLNRVYNLHLKEAPSILKIYLNSTLVYFNLPADHTPYTSLHIKSWLVTKSISRYLKVHPGDKEHQDAPDNVCFGWGPFASSVLYSNVVEERCVRQLVGGIHAPEITHWWRRASHKIPIEYNYASYIMNSEFKVGLSVLSLPLILHQ